MVLCSFFSFFSSVFSFQLCVHSGCSVFAPALLAVDVLYFVVPLSHTQRDFNLCQPSLFLSPLQKGATHTMLQRALSCSTNVLLHLRTPFQSQHFVMLTVRNSQTRLHQWKPKPHLKKKNKVSLACRKTSWFHYLFPSVLLLFPGKKAFVFPCFAICNWQLTLSPTWFWGKLIICEESQKENEWLPPILFFPFLSLDSKASPPPSTSPHLFVSWGKISFFFFFFGISVKTVLIHCNLHLSRESALKKKKKYPQNVRHWLTNIKNIQCAVWTAPIHANG